ncbi:MAG: NAD-binding D-isomer specific 2-hydroxyacid dehydrogenase [Actinobacteria bacterium 66_15]|nr:MAG: NAD-binding D-isomer specific 2-hydroxyacid dehydrogenase [Actinobacteria bacterium 66_15]
MNQDSGAATHPCDIHRLLLSGPLAVQVAERLGAAYPGLETRVVSEGPPSSDDLAWADAYTGFRLPEGFERSAIVWVHAMMAGVDALAPALRDLPRPVLLTRTVGDMPRKMGLYVLAYALADAHHLAEYREQQADRVWRPLDSPRIDGALAPILGTGEIGAGVAEALQGAGFDTCGVNRTGHEHPAFSRVAAATDPNAVPRETNVLVNTLPLTLETTGSIGMSVFGRLEGALFINVGRGASVAMDDLRRALELGHLRHAVLDVLPTEPPPADAWYWDHQKVTLTPHIAAVTDAGDVARSLSAALDDLRSGRPPESSVDLARGY